MNYIDLKTNYFWTYELLAELSFHSKTPKNKTVKLLCSRLLARHRQRENYGKYDILTNESLDIIDTSENNHVEENIDTDYSNNTSLLNGQFSSMEISNKQDMSCSQQILTSGDECSNMHEQFTSLNTDVSQEHSKWYEYWGKYGEDFVNETWIKQYGSCTTDDLSMDAEELYKQHCEHQYNLLYWKFVNEMNFADAKTEEDTSEIINNKECSSSYSVQFEDIDSVSNFDFLYKYKLFQNVNKKLVTVYRALSLMGLTYDDQNIFDSAYVEYLKKNLIKSTRHLNVYRYPKNEKSKKSDTKSNTKNSNRNTDSEDSEDSDSKQYKLSVANKSSTNICNKHEKNNINPKNKKMLNKEMMKQKRDQHIVEELERFGYSYLLDNPKLLKYWKKRHVLFSEFEKGIKLDEESWYSVTPEIISSYIAERCSCFLLVDPFCGAGGNIIQFARTCELVIAIDNDANKIKLARHNAELYGVADRIQFIIGDFFALAPTLKADVVFLSPPWGGPNVMQLEEYRLSNLMPDNGGGENILCLARQITSNLAIHLPKNTNIFDCMKSADDGFVEVQQNVLNSRFDSLTVYCSELYGLCDEHDNS